MKKTLALVLSILMVFSAVSMLSIVSFADATKIEIGKYGTGWENWSDQTQLLITAQTGMKDLDWTLTLAAGEESKTVTLKSSSQYDFGNGNSIYRFETCLGEGENQFVPVNGTTYTITASIKDAEGNELYYTDPTEGFSCEMDPIVPVAPEEVALELSKYGTGWENWSDQTQLLIVAATGLKDLDWTLTIAAGEESKTVTLKSSSQYDFGNGNSIYRFETCLGEGENQFVPANGTTYTITAVVEDTANNKIYKSVATEGFSCEMDPIVPAPSVETTPITIVPKFGKWENWVNSPNNPAGAGAEPGVTQLLVGISINGISADLTWKLTIAAGDVSKTITMAPATTAADYNLYRFETCMGEGENQFIPVKDTDYTVTIEVYDGENLLYKSEPTSGFVCPMDPVVPAPVVPDEPDEPQGPTYKVNGTVLTVLADVVGEGAGEDRVFPWSDIKDTITKVVVAKGVTKIDQRAFTKFANLEEVVIADTVTEIGADAFSYNAKLTTLTIPTSVTTIGQGIVYSCSGITTVYGGWESADAFKAVWSVKNYNTAFENAELKTYEDYTLVDGVLTLYKDIEAATEDAYPWAADKDSIKKIIIWDTVSVVGARAFSNCKNLEEVVVGNGVLVLKQDAFSYCSKLATITIPSTVGEIGQGIVYSSTGITTVYGGWETAEEFKAIWSVKNYNTAFEGEGVEYLVIGTVKEPVVTPPVPGGDDQKPGDNDQKPGDDDQKPGDNDQKPGTDDEQTGDTTTDTEEEGGFPTWAIAVIVIAVVAVAAGVVVVLKKKKD